MSRIAGRTPDEIDSSFVEARECIAQWNGDAETVEQATRSLITAWDRFGHELRLRPMGSAGGLQAPQWRFDVPDLDRTIFTVWPSVKDRRTVLCFPDANYSESQPEWPPHVHALVDARRENFASLHLFVGTTEMILEAAVGSPNRDKILTAGQRNHVVRSIEALAEAIGDWRDDS